MRIRIHNTAFEAFIVDTTVQYLVATGMHRISGRIIRPFLYLSVTGAVPYRYLARYRYRYRYRYLLEMVSRMPVSTYRKGQKAEARKLLTMEKADVQ